MKHAEDHLTRLLRDADPAPPPGLRHRALERAEHSLESSAGVDAWRWVWESRPLRLAWAAAVLALIAANLSFRQTADRPHAQAAPAEMAPEVEEAVRLPRLNPRYATPDIAAVAVSSPPAQHGGVPQTHKEVTS